MVTPNRRAGRALAAAVAAGAAFALSVPAGTAAPSPAPDVPRARVLGTDSPHAVKGHYIVVLKKSTGGAATAAALSQVSAAGGTVTEQYSAALKGFAARLPGRALDALRKNPAVDFIEADQVVRVSGTQRNPPWGLDRVDQRSPRNNGRYVYDRTGAGVTAYIIDTGIRKTHRQFGGRVLAGFTSIRDGRGTRDCNGHGTHVAGTVGGKAYGVAKRVTLRPVRVFDCSGYGRWSKVIAGVDWVTAHHKGTRPAVANMSLGGDASRALDSAVAAGIADGITFVIAAGNWTEDACVGSPARLGPALTVGSTDRSHTRSSFSNFGPCVDLFAPGSDVKSAWWTSDTATATLSGTSMATPHVAGAAALYLQGYPSASPDAVAQALVAVSTKDVVKGKGPGSPDRFLYSRGKLAPVVPSGSGNVVTNSGFESGAVSWTGSPNTITDDSGIPPRTGTWRAWLGGTGTDHTDTLQQDVTIPGGSRAALSFYLTVRSGEGFHQVYDRLRVQVVSGSGTQTLRTFTNRDHGTSYVQYVADLSAYAGSTVTLRFVSTEDSSTPTSFVLDDVTLTTG